MYIRKTKRVYKGKSYTNHLLVESVLTPKGPRQRTICSLGSLEPAPYEEWLALAHKMDSALQGQLSLSGSQAPTALLLARARKGRSQRRESATVRQPAGSLVVIDTDRVDTEEHREAGTVHVGHQIWRQLDMDTILGRAGLSKRARTLSEEMTLFNLDDTLYLYDLTSTYFEGQAKQNPQAKRGYSRDKRPDCKQVVVG